MRSEGGTPVDLRDEGLACIHRDLRTPSVARIDLNAATLPEFTRRVKTLHPHSERQWGAMSPAQMLAHLRIVYEISLEERETVDESRPWLMPVLWVLLFRLWTNWPKGKIKASPQFLENAATDIETERYRLIACMERFVARAETDPHRIVLEPMLGHVSLEKWRRIHGVHTDYHLRQFGA